MTTERKERLRELVSVAWEQGYDSDYCQPNDTQIDALLENTALAAERQFREKLEALRDALSEMIETHPLLGGLNTFQRKVFLEWTAKLTALLDER